MMRLHIALPALALSLAVLLSACAGQGAGTDPEDGTPAPYRTITAEEGKALMDEGGVRVVDVRRADEYEAGHIPGAGLLPNEELSDTPPEALPDLDEAVIVYCRTGVRSKQAADKLVAMGYTNVMDMGGITDWPYDTVTGNEPGIWPAPEEEAAAGILSRFTATDLDGNEVTQDILADYDLIMVNVWATYCGPCLREMPDLGELAAEYAPKGVLFLGLVSDVLNSDGTFSDSQLETARDIVAETGAAYTHLLPSQDLWGLLSQIPTVPTTFFVDSEGSQVGSAFSRSLSREQWIEVIDGMLAEVGQ